MTDINIVFCRVLLYNILRELTPAERTKYRKAGLTWSSSGSGNRYYHFEWPNMSADGSVFYWEGRADNASDARYKAISNWLEHHAAHVRAEVK